jgi:hypothetical protein
VASDFSFTGQRGSEGWRVLDGYLGYYDESDEWVDYLIDGVKALVEMEQ